MDASEGHHRHHQRAKKGCFMAYLTLCVPSEKRKRTVSCPRQRRLRLRFFLGGAGGPVSCECAAPDCAALEPTSQERSRPLWPISPRGRWAIEDQKAGAVWPEPQTTQPGDVMMCSQRGGRGMKRSPWTAAFQQGDDHSRPQ